MPSTQAAVGNRLLAKLPRKDRERFLAGCEPVDLPTDPAETHDAYAQLSHQATSSIFSVLVPPCTLR